MTIEVPMAYLNVEVRIFDPTIPFQTIKMNDPTIDTWHNHVIIKREAIRKLEHVKPFGTDRLELSGGMSIDVDLVKIGIQIGDIRINDAEALIVEHGYHDILLGSDIFNEAFQVGQSREGEAPKATVFSDQKADPEGLSIEFFPVNPPAYLKDVEKVIRNSRILHNVHLLSTDPTISFPADQIFTVAENEEGIPDRKRLVLNWIDTGSIWITLKSGSTSSLKYLASMFETGASAKLAESLATAKKAEADADISQATRDSTANVIIQEQEMLNAENITRTHQAWRNEILKRIEFTDKIIDKISDKETRDELKKQRDQALLELANTHVLPLVRNVPRHVDLQKEGDPILLLGPSTDD